MKVGNLKKGMILRVTELKQVGWLASGKYALSCGDAELRFIRKGLELIVPGRCIYSDSLIIYLGKDKVIHKEGKHKKHAETTRRVMIENEIAVVRGCNFRHLAPHPDFL